MRKPFFFVSACLFTVAAASTFAAEPAWPTGTKVEVKWSRSYRAAVVSNHVNGWYLITYTPGTIKEWVEPWRVRAVGSTDDPGGTATPNHAMLGKIDPVPTAKPSAGPNDPKAVVPPALTVAATSPAPDPIASTKTDPVPLTADPTYFSADAASVSKITLDPVTSASPLPIEAIAPPHGTPKPIMLPPTSNVFDGPKSLFIPHSGTSLFVTSGDARPTHASVKIEQIDLEHNTIVTTFPIPPDLELLDVTADDNALLFRSAGDTTHPAHLEIYTKAPGGPQRSRAFIPAGASATWPEGDILAAALVDPTHVLVATGVSATHVVLWDIVAGKPVYAFDLASRNSFALSNHNTTVAVHLKDHLFLLNALTGKMIAQLDHAPPTPTELAFSPSGKSLAAYSFGELRVWDLASPTSATPTTDVTFGLSGNSFQLISDTFALVDHEILIELEHKLILWRYTGVPKEAALASSGTLYVSSKVPRAKQVTVTPIALPGPAPLAFLKSLNTDDVMALHPGMAVSVDLNFSADDKKKQEILAAVTGHLTLKNITVADNQPVHFVLTTETGKSEEHTFTNFSGAPNQKATVTEQISRIALQVQGKTLWERKTTVNPGNGMISHTKDQSLEQAIAALSKPDLAYFTTVDFPTFVPTPHEPAWLGTSDIAPAKK